MFCVGENTEVQPCFIESCFLYEKHIDIIVYTECTCCSE